jgi:hypothetical protein
VNRICERSQNGFPAPPQPSHNVGRIQRRLRVIDMAQLSVHNGSNSILVERTSFLKHLLLRAILSRTVGSVLLLAAALKATALISNSSPVLGPRWLWFLITGYESILGCLLLVGQVTPSIWAMVLSTFAMFPLIGLWASHHGAHTCGCFGGIKITVKTEVGINILMVVALMFCRPHKIRSARKSMAIGALIPLTGGIATILLMHNSEPVTIENIIPADDSNQIVLLEPAKWRNKSFPLFNFLDDPGPLKRGNWRILFVHDDCPVCLGRIPAFQAESVGSAENGAGQKAAVVVVPPVHTVDFPNAPYKKPYLILRLSDKKDWFMETPCEVWMVDGLVVNVNDHDTRTSG